MSVTLARWGLSNPSLKPWVITVLVIIVITWGVAADIVSAYTDVLALLSALYTAGAVQQRSTANGPDRP